MTREEQITFKAGSIADGCIAHGAPWKGYYQGFIEGAKWADANPPQPSLPPNLDKAAEKYTDDSLNNLGAILRVNVSNAFKAGAEWMAEQGHTFETIMQEDDVDELVPTCPDMYNHGYSCGDKVIVQIRKKQ